MVLIKAAFNREIRKMSVGTDIVYSELVQKLIGVFPSLKGVKESNVRLFYKDTDGDQICFCSDEELRTALQCIGEDNTLRILIGVEEERQEEPTTEVLLLDTDDFWNEPFGHAFPSLLGSLGHHHHHHFGPIGGFFRQQALREREEQLRQQRLYEEKVRKAELERRKALMEKVKQAREEKMKHLAEARRKSQDVSCTSSSNKPLIPEFPPGWTVTPFGSWEPAVHEGPHFKQWSWGPYGYHATYGSSSESAESEKKAEAQNEEKMDDQPSQEGSESATTTEAAQQ